MTTGAAAASMVQRASKAGASLYAFGFGQDCLDSGPYIMIIIIIINCYYIYIYIYIPIPIYIATCYNTCLSHMCIYVCYKVPVLLQDLRVPCLGLLTLFAAHTCGCRVWS